MDQTGRWFSTDPGRAEPDGVLSQVTLRPDLSQEFDEADSLLTGPAVVRLVGRNGEARVADERSEMVGVGKVFRQIGVVQSAVVEERGPGRVVIALKGSFSTAKSQSPQRRSLDFTARLYFYANSPLVQMTLSVRNRQLESMANFVGIERLAVEVPLKTLGQVEGSLSVDGKTVREKLSADKPLALIQSARNVATIDLPSGKNKTGKKSPGWVRLASDAGTLTAGNRWFWQTYPKGVIVRPDGLVSLELKPKSGKRVDLFTAGAKTHFLYFCFAKDRVTKEASLSPQSLAAGTTQPLVAVCDPNWTCQETHVFGDLFANNLDLFDSKYRDVIRKYQVKLDECLHTLVNNRSRENWPSGVDEYGWLDFGSGLHHRTTTKKSSEESWWDSNYYDFPHALLVNYLRTGDPLSLKTAEEAGLHLADIDICHSYPGHSAWAGCPRSGPTIGHFRNYARETPYMGHNSFTFSSLELTAMKAFCEGMYWNRP